MQPRDIQNNIKGDFPGAIYQEYFPLMKKTMWARKVDLELDTPIVHEWMNRDHVAEFWNMAVREEKIRDYLSRCQEKRTLPVISRL